MASSTGQLSSHAAIATAPPSARSLALYMISDLLISLFSLGCFHGHFSFDPNILLNELLLRDGFSFTQDAVEFVFLAILRCLALVVLALLVHLDLDSSVLQHRLRHALNVESSPIASKLLDLLKSGISPAVLLDRLLFGALLCNVSFSLCKLLAFSEHESQLLCPGVWLSIAWNCVSFGVFYRLSTRLIHSKWAKGDGAKDNASETGSSGSDLNPSEASSDDESSASCPDTEVKPLIMPSESILNGTEKANDNAEKPKARENSDDSSDDDPSDDENAGMLEEDKETIQGLSAWSQVLFAYSYTVHYWRWFLVALVCQAVDSMADMFLPYYTGQILSDSVDFNDYDSLVHNIVMMTVLTLASTVFEGLHRAIFGIADSEVQMKVRQDLFDAITRQEIGFFDQCKTGEILSRLMGDCYGATSIVGDLKSILVDACMTLGAVVFMFSISWRLALVVFVVAPPVVFLSKLYGDYEEWLCEKLGEGKADANVAADEVIGAMRTVRSFACEHIERKRFAKLLEEEHAVNKKQALLGMGFSWMYSLTSNAILISTLIYGAHLVRIGKMNAALMYFSWYYSSLVRNLASSKKVYFYIKRQPLVSLDGEQKPEVEGRLVFENVTFSYPTRPETTVIKDLSFEILPGETVALVGRSGAGKSSIIALIERFYDPDSGRIVLDGEDVKEIDHIYYHNKVSLVAQEPVLYDESVLYNILYGCDASITKEDAIEAAKAANINHFVLSTTDGYETKCGEKGVQMSGGQKQRIAIARALVRNPKVLILDEATSALDAESEYLIQKALHRCAAGRTVIIIAHRLSTVKKADRILVIDEGRLIESGSHDELMQLPEGMYRSLVRRQLRDSESEGDEENGATENDFTEINT